MYKTTTLPFTHYSSVIHVSSVLLSCCAKLPVLCQKKIWKETILEDIQTVDHRKKSPSDITYISDEKPGAIFQQTSHQ